MRAIVLADNVPANGLEAEWGLSIYIEHEGRRILLDAGASGLFRRNAERLGIDLSAVDIAVLSHAHYDHANGMTEFLALNDHASLYLQRCCRANCYSGKERPHRYIGLPEALLTELSGRLVRVDGDLELYPGAWLVAHSAVGLERIGEREQLLRRERDAWRPDDFDHEQSLVLETRNGPVILSGCSHAGAATIIREIEERFPDKRIYGIIGGFHLYDRTDDEVRGLAGQLRQIGVEYVCTGHCTMERAADILEEELGARLHRLCTGLTIEV